MFTYNVAKVVQGGPHLIWEILQEETNNSWPNWCWGWWGCTGGPTKGTGKRRESRWRARERRKFDSIYDSETNKDEEETENDGDEMTNIPTEYDWDSKSESEQE